MKKLVLILLLCLLLTGCMNWMDGAAYSIEPHQEVQQQQGQSIPAVAIYSDLLREIEKLVEQGAEMGLLSVDRYSANLLKSGMERVINYIIKSHPIGAYAVTDISYEIGTVGNNKAMAVTIQYSRSPEEIRAVQTAANMEEAASLLCRAVENSDAGLVLRIEQFQNLDLTQLVENYAQKHPETVMEIPVLTVTTYPENGVRRVVDIRLSYQTNRETLKNMQRYVLPIFASAALYVSNEEEGAELKYSRLHAFLMERSDYKLDSSITPAYSLLRHGVGDSRAFAVVYSAMCRRSGLECLVVSGTRYGEARFWNIVCINDIYYHVDLLDGWGFRALTDGEMAGYVWDYSSYPACVVPEAPQETTGK